MTFPREAWPRVKELFEGARVLPLDARATYLAAACGGDEAMRREVESLLASHEQVTSFLETPAVVVGGDTPSTKSLEGQCIGAYQVLARIGTGGMGEVYRARDTKLNRHVAIKVLLPAVANDPDRLARFSREAQLLASLNHPHIAQIHGLDDTGGVHALVLELVDGPTLADRIAQGAIPIAETLPIAKQIAEALEAAHEQGIIHRDLKPANIKIRDDGTVKVLDFGLAKALQSTTPVPGVYTTDAHVVLGTAAYMSPEQARGRSVDERADLWAFGAVLYEMVTGRPAFASENVSDTLAHVLMKDPDWNALPVTTPLPIRRLLRRCLEKDRSRRLDSAAAARLEIDDALASPHGETFALAAVPWRRMVASAALAGGAMIAVFGVWILMRPAPVTPALPSRFAIVPSPEPPLNVSGSDRDLALSPDGRSLVYRAGGSNTAGSPLMMRAIDQLDAQPVADVARADGPFFSPDSRWIGFFENLDLKKVSIGGGPAVTLCRVSGVPLGASWGDDNTITFATNSPGTGVWRVSADGGEPTVLTTPDAAQDEGTHAFPSMLPRGRGVLFTIRSAGRGDTSHVAVLDLKTGQRKPLIRGGSDGHYIETGHVIFAAAGKLRAVPFDPVRLEVLGDPVTVVEPVMMKPSGVANYSVSQHGTLVYMPRGPGIQETPRSIVWVDRKGREEPTKAPVRAYNNPRLSPDGTRVAASVHGQNADVWIWDIARETQTQLTFDPGIDALPLWAPDGRRIIFMSNRAGVLNLYAQSADGAGTALRLTTTATPHWPTSVTPDGTRVVGFEIGARTRRDLVMFSPEAPSGAGALRRDVLLQTQFDEGLAEVSPNGRYLAYHSNESGQDQVYVRPFPNVESGRWQISAGTRPVWARSGRELFFLDESNTLTVVAVSTSGPTFSMGIPAKFFDTKYAEPNPTRHYDVSADGQRFLMLRDSPAGAQNTTPASMIAVLNWFEELKPRVPTSGK